MTKPIGFKQFINVDYKPGEDELIKYQASKRKESVEHILDEVDEALSTAQRRKVGMRMKRLAPRMKIARARQAKRTADLPRLKKRAAKKARMEIFKKLTKGKAKSDMAPQQRAAIEKRMEKMKSRIDKLAVRMLPKVRTAEKERKQSANRPKD